MVHCTYPRVIMVGMLRWTTAGESHGQALIAMLEHMPAVYPLTVMKFHSSSLVADSAMAAVRA